MVWFPFKVAKSEVLTCQKEELEEELGEKYGEKQEQEGMGRRVAGVITDEATYQDAFSDLWSARDGMVHENTQEQVLPMRQLYGMFWNPLRKWDGRRGTEDERNKNPKTFTKYVDTSTHLRAM